MRTSNFRLTVLTFVLGVAISGCVTAFVPEDLWKGYQVMFVLIAGLVAEKVFGAVPSSGHRFLTYGLAALFHGLLLALLVFLLSMMFPRMTRRASVMTLAAVTVLDVVLLLVVSPMHDVL